MISAGNKIARILLTGLVAALAASPARVQASGFWFPHGHHHRYVSTGTAVTTNVGTSGVLMPMGLTTVVGNGGVVSNGVVANNAAGALLPASVGTNLFTASVPVYYTTGASTGVQPIAGSAASNTASPLLPNSIAPASLAPANLGPAAVATGGDYLAEYNAFVTGENLLPASAGIAPADMQHFGTSFASLTGAVGGPARLGSLGRFLRTKVGDPNFQAKGLDLIIKVIGATNPGLIPAIETFRPLMAGFLNALKQQAQPTPPVDNTLPLVPPPPTDDSPFGELGNTGRELKVRVIFDNAPPAQVNGGPAEPGPGSVTSPLDTIEAVVRAMGGTVVSKDASGITVRTVDNNRTVKFDASGKPIIP